MPYVSVCMQLTNFILVYLYRNDYVLLDLRVDPEPIIITWNSKDANKDATRSPMKKLIRFVFVCFILCLINVLFWISI